MRPWAGTRWRTHSNVWERDEVVLPMHRSRAGANATIPPLVALDHQGCAVDCAETAATLGTLVPIELYERSGIKSAHGHACQMIYNRSYATEPRRST